MPDIAAAQVLVLLRQGDLTAAAHLAETHALPISQSRVHLAQGDASTALAVLEPLRQQMEAKAWADERLTVMVLQAVAQHMHGEAEKAVHALGDALTLAKPGGFVRLFVDEGEPMRLLILDFRLQIKQRSTDSVHPQSGYTDKLLAAFVQAAEPQSKFILPHSEFVSPLSQRELEILRLLAKGLSNQEISARLFLALSTVKGHNRILFDKLQVQSRTEAIARARELGLL